MKPLGFLACLCLLSYSNNSAAQDKNIQELREYTLTNTTSNVQFFKTTATCQGKAAILLKFNNRNDHDVKVTWKELFVTSQVTQETEGFREKEIILPPGVTSVSDCNDANHRDLIVAADNVSPTYSADILEFKFKDIRVVAIK
jgi:hypothetical protein